MKRAVAAIALAFAVGVPVVPMSAMAGPALNEVLHSGCTRTVCTVRDNPGGEVEVFKLAARELVKEGKRLVVDGVCASACVIMADIARSNTCVTANARMQVHKSTIVRFTGKSMRDTPVAELVRREDPPQSQDINKWVYAHGGYPTDGLLTIPVSEARRFWASCS